MPSTGRFPNFSRKSPTGHKRSAETALYSVGRRGRGGVMPGARIDAVRVLVSEDEISIAINRRLREALAGRFFCWAALVATFLVAAAGTRAALIVRNWSALDAPWHAVPAVFGIGFVYDVAAALYLFAPFAFYLWLLPERLFQLRAHRALLLAACAATVFGLFYLVPVEWFFFDEFNARFNQVAVDYLVS